MNLQVVKRVLRRQVHGELIKLKRLSGLTSILLLFVAFFVLMFFQKGFNIHSGFYTPELLTIGYMSSFNLLLFSLIGFIPLAVLGATLAGAEYKYNTNVYTIGNIGRTSSIFIKIMTLFLITLIFVLFMVFLGLIESVIVMGTISTDIDLGLLSTQIFSCFLILSGSGLLGFLGALLTKKTYGGIIIGTVVPLIFKQVISYMPVLGTVTIDKYTTAILNHAFSNLSNDPQIQVYSIQPMSFPISVSIVCALLVLLIGSNMVIINKRNFNS
jgi:hypothetical protein